MKLELNSISLALGDKNISANRLEKEAGVSKATVSRFRNPGKPNGIKDISNLTVGTAVKIQTWLDENGDDFNIAEIQGVEDSYESIEIPSYIISWIYYCQLNLINLRRSAKVDDLDLSLFPERKNAKKMKKWIQENCHIYTRIWRGKAHVVTIPRFVADWLASAKNDQRYITAVLKDAPKEIDDWLHHYENQEKLMKAWTGLYTVKD